MKLFLILLITILSVCLCFQSTRFTRFNNALTMQWGKEFDKSKKIETTVKNDAFTRANRASRAAGASDRIVEIRQPLGMDLDEDNEGNVFVKKIDPKGRAAKTGMVFEGDRIAMVSATFGDDMWSARGVGLERVVSSIKVRNTKPVKLVLEAPNEALEKKRQAIAFAELSEAEKAKKEAKDKELLAAMQDDDKALRGKRNGFLGLW